MTDHPRFRFIAGEHDVRHRHYHGAPVVDLVLGLVDWWLKQGDGATIVRFRSPDLARRAQHDVAQG
jgi:hypothetical protein